jgi:cytochrome P450
VSKLSSTTYAPLTSAKVLRQTSKFLSIMVGHANTISAPYLLLGAAALYFAYNIVLKLQKDAHIRKLGARAPIRRSYLPWSVDFAYDVLKNAMNNQMLEMWQEAFAKSAGPGQYTLEAGVGERVILTAEPENIKAILATQFKDYGKGEAFRKDWYSFLGNGIFATDGEMWHDSRQLIRPQFVKDRLSDIEIFEKHAQVLISKIVQSQEIDTLDMMFRFTLDASTDFLLGESADSLQKPQQLFADAFGNVQRIQSTIARVGYVIQQQHQIPCLT